MNDFDDEFFGDDRQVQLAKRSANLYTLLKNDPRFAYYGRVVAVSDPGEETAELLMTLARLQGAGVSYYYPKRDTDALYEGFRAAGFGTDRHEHYRGGENTYRASLKLLETVKLPPDITIARLDRDTPTGLIRQIAQLSFDCGVLPVSGATMRGLRRPGIDYVALDSNGEPVANGASILTMHPDSAHGGDVFWGMLATREDRRGQGLALVLGAMAIKHMWEEKGARGFITGVREGNLSSHRLCDKLGVEDTEWCYATCIDPETLGRGSVTK